jgi:hypothetical protein
VFQADELQERTNPDEMYDLNNYKNDIMFQDYPDSMFSNEEIGEKREDAKYELKIKNKLNEEWHRVLETQP